MIPVWFCSSQTQDIVSSCQQTAEKDRKGFPSWDLGRKFKHNQVGPRRVRIIPFKQLPSHEPTGWTWFSAACQILLSAWTWNWCNCLAPRWHVHQQTEVSNIFSRRDQIKSLISSSTYNKFMNWCNIVFCQWFMENWCPGHIGVWSGLRVLEGCQAIPIPLE